MTTSKPPSEPKKCDAPNCLLEGLYPAPKSPQQLKDYLWFCQTHVRAYNLRWNFYANLTPEEIERLNGEDRGGRRPTWPLGYKTRGQGNPLELLHEGLQLLRKMRSLDPSQRVKLAPEEWEALKLLQLNYPFTAQELKAHYLKLVKKYHPDRHLQNPDKKTAAEEIFKRVSAAYKLVKSRFCEPLS